MASEDDPSPRPALSRAGLVPTHAVEALDARGEPIALQLPGEYPLRILLDGVELVTLMTLGARPEELVLGYLRNQQLVADLAQIAAVSVDWRASTATVRCRPGALAANWAAQWHSRPALSGCAQGSAFVAHIDALQARPPPPARLRQSTLYALVRQLAQRNDIYRLSGGVHGCALCDGEQVLVHIEDVGRHNAADAVAGYLWLEDIDAAGKVFYTTGRLTSEMVLKGALMGCGTLVSRSSVTRMGQLMGERLGMTLIGRARGQHFVLCSGAAHFAFDAPPAARPPAPATKGGEAD